LAKVPLQQFRWHVCEDSVGSSVGVVAIVVTAVEETMQTITHRVRTFLRQQGAAIEPWSGLDAALYVLLDRRRNDPAPWLQL
jgi:hypothetical protein